jgi:molybdate transport system substrate-binding protein
MTHFRNMLILAGAAIMFAAFPARANELVVWAGGAVKSAVTDMLPSFGTTSGVVVAADFAPMGTLMRRMADKPDSADVVILAAEVMDEAIKKGWVVAGSVTELGRVGVGVAVNERAPVPDISTAEAFKATLLAAKSIVMIDPETGTSGKHLAQVFEKLGVADAIKARTTFLQGGFVVERVATGEIELGLHQITEILPVKGIKLVGPLPAELQKVTIYQAAHATKPKNIEAAKAFLVHLQSPDVRTTLVAKGFMAK